MLIWKKYSQYAHYQDEVTIQLSICGQLLILYQQSACIDNLHTAKISFVFDFYMGYFSYDSMIMTMVLTKLKTSD